MDSHPPQRARHDVGAVGEQQVRLPCTGCACRLKRFQTWAVNDSAPHCKLVPVCSKHFGRAQHHQQQGCLLGLRSVGAQVDALHRLLPLTLERACPTK
eukprot:5869154-Prymnesium_polylepis.2